MGVRGPLSRDSGHLARDAVVCNGASGGAKKRLASGCIWGILHFHVIYIKQSPKAEAETCVSSDIGAIEAHEPVDATCSGKWGHGQSWGREGVFAELFGPVAALQCCHPHTAGHTTAKLSRTPSQALTGKSGLGAFPWSPLVGELFLGSLGFTSPNFHLLEGGKAGHL